MPKNGDARTAQEQVDAHIESDVRNAVRALANAAATAQAGRTLLVISSGDEHQLWFLVRALCHEHGMDLAGVMARANHIAATRIARLQP